nr:immunoglobulin light chain junction region [Macaca mulatta]
CQQGYTYPYSC